MLEKPLSALPEVALVFSKTGMAEMASDPMPRHFSDTFVILKPRDQWPNPAEPCGTQERPRATHGRGSRRAAGERL